MKAQRIKTGLLATAGIMLCASAAGAAVISEAEPNNGIATAQHIDLSSFTVGPNSDITNSDIWPWVSIAGTGDGSIDYYSFNVYAAGITGIFDIDYGYTYSDGRTPEDMDSYLRLYDSEGNLLFTNDDSSTSNGAAGSESGLDSFIQYTFSEPGTYIIAAKSYPDIPIPSGRSYELQISLSQVPIPMDTTPMDATGQIIIKNFVYDRDMAAFSLQGVEGIGAAAQDAVDNGTGLTFTAEADNTLITFTADSNELDVGGNRLVYSNDTTLVRCKFDTEVCTVQLSYTNLDGAALDEQLTGEMNVSLEVGGNLYLNTGEWTQIDSGSGSWTKYRKDN
jgi:hypothetical protein